jgi:steroid delta-isomerase-like uncharacterized protein
VTQVSAYLRKENFAMTAEENKAIARRSFTAWGANDQAALNELLAPDLVVHPSSSSDSWNRQTLLESISMFGAAFRDQHYTIEDQIAEGDKVVTRCTWRSIHSGDFQGLAPTGKQIVISAFFVERIKEGKVVEVWPLYDRISMMQQLGLVPPPPPAR